MGVSVPRSRWCDIVVNPATVYRVAQARSHLRRLEGVPDLDVESLDRSGRGVLLQFRAPIDRLPQPAPLCFENQWQPGADAGLCETPLRTGTLNLPIVNDARLVGPGLVLTSDDMILDKSIGRHAERFGIETHADGTCRFARGLLELTQQALRTGSVSTHERAAILLFDPAIHHFGMWVLKCLPRLRVLTLLADAAIDVVVPTNVPDKFLSLMESLGIGPERVVFHDPRGISTFRRLIVPPKIYKPGSSRYGNPFEVFCTGATRGHRPGSRLAVPGTGPTRIYVSRRGNRRRRLASEKVVEQLFGHHGFHVVEPSRLTAVETLSLFRDCEFIAGPLGSGLYNVLFSQRAPKALVLTPPVTKFENLFVTMHHVCSAKGGAAVFVFGRTVAGSSDGDDVFDYTWEIDMVRLRETLTALAPPTTS